MTSSNGRGQAYDAGVTVGVDARSERERADAERAQAADTVARLKTKKDKAEQALADAEQALADAEAELGGGA